MECKSGEIPAQSRLLYSQNACLAIDYLTASAEKGVGFIISNKSPLFV